MKLNAIVAAGVLTVQALIGPFAMAGMGQGPSGGVVTGFVVPKEVGANEPFTFAAQGVVEGEVISVQTVDGEVVQAKKADKFGRVFLAAGLAAGAYTLLHSGGKGKGQLQVQLPRTITPGGPLTITDPPAVCNISEGLTLNGSGMSADVSQHQLTLGGKQFPILAGTATEVKTGPLPASVCGTGPAELKNSTTGEMAKIADIATYSLSAKLGRQKLANGEQTTLEFTFIPGSLIALVSVRILSGPVSFGAGTKEKIVEVKNGVGRAALQADPASQGAFRVAYDIHEIRGAGRTYSNEPPLKGAGVGGGDPVDNRAKRCPLTKHIRDEAGGWEQSEKTIDDPANPGKKKTIYIIKRTIRCNIHKSCSKREGHSGECAFTGKSRCQDHDTTETREYDSEEARKDGMKDTAIPDSLKFPK